MENLSFEKTKNTLKVNMDVNGECLLEGSSFPENASEFFKPIIDWLQRYMLEVTGKITLNLEFDYLNSSSIKFISDIIDKLESYYKSGGEAEIIWRYDDDDDDIREMGEELQEEVGFTFNIVKNRD